MSSRAITVGMMKRGLLPAEIAGERGLAISTILQHIRLQLGEGFIRPIEVVLIYNNASPNLDELFMKHKYHAISTFQSHAEQIGHCREEARLYFEIRESNNIKGDLYVFMSNIECGLHNFIRVVLMRKFGSEKGQWWRFGVPEKVRIACVTSQELDHSPVIDPYCYTTFIHLSDIICDSNNWKTFRPLIPQNIIHDVRAFKHMLVKLNNLRNDVMHPVKHKCFSHDELVSISSFHHLTQCLCVHAGVQVPTLHPVPYKIKVPCAL